MQLTKCTNQHQRAQAKKNRIKPNQTKQKNKKRKQLTHSRTSSSVSSPSAAQSSSKDNFSRHVEFLPPHTPQTSTPPARQQRPAPSKRIFSQHAPVGSRTVDVVTDVTQLLQGSSSPEAQHRPCRSSVGFEPDLVGEQHAPDWDTTALVQHAPVCVCVCV